MNASSPAPDGEPGAGDPPDDEVLAGELVLGVLAPAERRRAQTRAVADREFSARVAAWERRFAPWLAEVAPLAPSAQLWPQICRRLGWEGSAGPGAGLWQSLALWRSAAALAAIAALALWLARPQGPQPPPAAAAVATAVTTLAHDDGTPGWLASVDAAHGTVLLVPVPGAPDAQGRVPELWIIPAGKAPRSLGAVSINQSGTVAVPADARRALVAGSVLAISLEPASGMPHAAPSGPIIAKGAIQT
jgi:anti-sigma-K factor RskA